jgi:3-carboxy-cis,cis-muconate cycloisomerase
MLSNLKALRLVLPTEAADEWFNPALALHAADVTRAQLTALKALNSIQAGDKSKINQKAKR